jgi:hypothetical protein
MARQPGAFSKAKPARDAKQRAWATMRRHRHFTVAELQALAEIGKDNALKYLKALAAVGIVKVIKDRESGRIMGHKVWHLVRDLGPKRPLTWKDGRVYDPNLDQVFERLTTDDKETAGTEADGTGMAGRTAAGL